MTATGRRIVAESEGIPKGAPHSVITACHLVFLTKYRRSVLSGRALRILRDDFESVCLTLGVELIEVNGEDDHVHLLVKYPPALQLSHLVNELKAHRHDVCSERRSRHADQVRSRWRTGGRGQGPDRCCRPVTGQVDPRTSRLSAWKDQGCHFFYPVLQRAPERLASVV
jgi:REP element-mobilizing transposase RayT